MNYASLFSFDLVEIATLIDWIFCCCCIIGQALRMDIFAKFHLIVKNVRSDIVAKS